MNDNTDQNTKNNTLPIAENQLDTELDKILEAFSYGYSTPSGKITKEEAKSAINQLLLKARRDELQTTFDMNGTHEGDWKEAIKDRIAELEKEIT